MSVSDAIVRRLQPPATGLSLQAQLAMEASKGCSAERGAEPVCLEPPYVRIGGAAQPIHSGTALPDPARLSWYVVLADESQPLPWGHAEMWVRQLSRLRGPAIFQLAGNAEQMEISVALAPEDTALLETTFAGTFPLSFLQASPDRAAADCESTDSSAALLDFFPPPPYWHRLTRPGGLPDSPLKTVLAALAQVPSGLRGIYQVVFQPTAPDHDWHHNIETLHDLEYAAKRLGESAMLSRFPQDLPSADRNVVARDIDVKADSDRAMFAAALRVAVTGSSDSRSWIGHVAAFAGLLQHGGRQLRWLTENDYAKHPGCHVIPQMLNRGVTYRHGFLVNAAELTSLVHLPPIEPIVSPLRQTRPLGLESLGHQQADDTGGVSIGTTRLGAEARETRIREKERFVHTHIVGTSGQGKSTLMEHMILQDCAAEEGVAVIDPHGQLIEGLLSRMPVEHAERAILLDFSDPERVPLFNPLRCIARQAAGRVAADIVAAIKRVVEGWGDRLEYLLRLTLYGLALLPDSTFADVSEVLADGPRCAGLKRAVLQRSNNALLRRFWEHDLGKYRAADRAPVQHKLIKLLSEEPLGSMLTQPDNRIDLMHIMTSGGMLLADLSGLSVDSQKIFGSLLLALLRLAAVGRRSTAIDDRLKPFHVHADEAYLFDTSAVDELLVQGRKFATSLTLAHQHLGQYPKERLNALTGVGSTIVFRVGWDDAGYYHRQFKQRVRRETIADLPSYTAIAHVGDELLRITTTEPAPVVDPAARARVLAASTDYYVDASQLRLQRQIPKGTPVRRSPYAGRPEFEYDTFD